MAVFLFSFIIDTILKRKYENKKKYLTIKGCKRLLQGIR